METRKQDFSLSLLFFWIKGHIAVDQRFIKVNTANTVLGLIPAGTRNESIPLSNVSSANINTSYKVLPMIFGIVISLGAIGSLTQNVFGALVMLFLGVLIFGSGILTTLSIQRAGSDFVIQVPFYEKQKMIDMQDVIMEALVYTEDKKDFTANTNRVITAILKE